MYVIFALKSSEQITFQETIPFYAIKFYITVKRGFMLENFLSITYAKVIYWWSWMFFI